MLTVYVVDAPRLAIREEVINMWRNKPVPDARFISCAEMTDRASVHLPGPAMYVVVQNNKPARATPLVVQVFLRTGYKKGSLLANAVVIPGWVKTFYKTPDFLKLIKEHGITHIFLVPAGYIS